METKHTSLLKLLDKVYIVSDLHLGHRNIIKYCNRPFYKDNKPCESAMDEYLLRQIDELPKGSILLNLGDVFFNKYRNYCPILNNFNRRLCKKTVKRMKQNKTLILLLGNHDTVNGKRSAKAYKSLGFDEVYTSPVYISELDLVFSHEPINKPKYSSIRNIHGHIHNNSLAKNNCFNASVEETGYKPVKLTEILDRLGIDKPIAQS